MKINDLKAMALRVYNNEMKEETKEDGTVISDSADIQALCDRTFNNGSVTNERLAQFNEVVLRTAETIAEPKLNQIMSYFCQYQQVPANTTVIYELPKDAKPKLVWTALGSGVDLIRLTADKTRKPAVAQAMSVGAYYEVTAFTANAMEAFRNVVDRVAEVLVEFYFEKIGELVAKAIQSGDIPAKNCADGTNLTIKEFKKAEDVMIRIGGGRPLFIADTALINSLGETQKTADAGILLTDDLKASLREDLTLSKLSKSIAVNLINPYIDEANSKVKFDPSVGYLFASVQGKKPIAITKFGQTRQYTDFDSETEQIALKIVMENDITLLNGRYMGVVSDDAIEV